MHRFFPKYFLLLLGWFQLIYGIILLFFFTYGLEFGIISETQSFLNYLFQSEWLTGVNLGFEPQLQKDTELFGIQFST